MKVDVYGAGTFLAVGSANPYTENHITDKKCHLYRETAIVIVKSKEAEETKITVTAEGVKSGVCTISAK